MPNKIGGKLLVGGIAASFVLWILLQYDAKLAWLYLAALLLSVIMVYRIQFFGSLSAISAYLKTL